MESTQAWRLGQIFKTSGTRHCYRPRLQHDCHHQPASNHTCSSAEQYAGLEARASTGSGTEACSTTEGGGVN
jgi:hypothetical protein